MQLHIQPNAAKYKGVGFSKEFQSRIDNNFNSFLFRLQVI